MSVQSTQLTRIEPQSGTAFRLRRGETLRVVDLEGEQVADLIAFAEGDLREHLSSGRTFDYESTLRLTAGNTLYSNRSRPMLTLLRDDVGRHDFLLTPCSHETFAIIYGNHDEHPSCFDNIVHALEPYGIEPDSIPVTFNIFMNVDIAQDGRIAVLPPLSKAGDAVEFRAEMDLVVALTACSAEMSNNYSFKPVAYTIGRTSASAPPI